MDQADEILLNASKNHDDTNDIDLLKGAHKKSRETGIDFWLCVLEAGRKDGALKCITALSQTLDPVVRLALLDGPKWCGSYEPMRVLARYEESMTHDQYVTASKFLVWVQDNKKTYGHNIDKVYKEYLMSK